MIFNRGSWAFLVFLGLISQVFPHGGFYGGPQDTVPPGAGIPGASGPVTAGPKGPAPKSIGPQTGVNGPRGATGPGHTGGPRSQSSTPYTQGLSLGPDLSPWIYWWEFNKAGFLNLKAAIRRPKVVTGSEDDLFSRQGKRRIGDLGPSPDEIESKVKPALLKALEQETNNDIVTGCLIALGKIGNDPALVDVLGGKLADPNQEISETAAVSLGILSFPDAIPVLKALLEDNAEGRKWVSRHQVPTRTRSFAAYGLGLVGFATTDPKIREGMVQTLIQVLEKDRTSSRDLGVACIVALGLFQNKESQANLEGNSLQEDPGRTRALEFLRSRMWDAKLHAITKAHIPTSLAKLTGPHHPLADVLIRKFLKLYKVNKKEFVRQSVVLALGTLARQDRPETYEAALKKIKHVARKGREQERNFALISLGKMGGPDPQHTLLKTLHGKRSTQRPWAALGLAILGHEQKQAGETEDEILVQSLVEMLSGKMGKNPRNLGAYAIALGILQVTEAKNLLLQTMKNTSDEEFQGYCAVALGMVGNRDQEILIEIRKVVDGARLKPQLLQQASIGLGLLGDKNLVLDLVSMLEKARALSVQGSLAMALGFIGDKRSVDPLIDMLQKDSISDVARGFAAVSLGLVCDKEIFPWNYKISSDLNYRASVRTLNDAGSATGIINIL